MSKERKKSIQSVKQNLPVTIKKGINIPEWAPIAVVIFTALLYSKALQNDFVYWDDDIYILKNPYLRDFSLKGIIAVFSKFNNSNYHPLTTLTNLLEYKYFGLNPFPYHLINVVLHLLNTWLVFRLAEGLSGKKMTALIVCILFAVHPLHVESVAWLSERKDVLYASFYLLTLLTYLRYVASAFSKKQYAYTLLLFLAALLSKSAAVTLPFLLIAIDIYKGRKINAKSLIEKIPFILLSLLFGILAIMSQKAGGGLHLLPGSFGFIDKIFLFTSRIAFYIIELVIPFRLSAINCLPVINNGILPWYYYLSLPFILLLAGLITRKNKHTKEITFGVAFFLITISVMLQVINVGYAITAERYTYIPYIGLFYIVAQWLSTIINKYPNYVISIFFLFVIVFSTQTWNRISVWKDTNVLFSDMIKKNSGNPLNSGVYYLWGYFKSDEGDLQGALQDYSYAIELNPEYEKAHYNRGLIYYKVGNFKNALDDFNKVIQLDPKYADYYNSRGIAYYEAGDIKSALTDLDKAIILDAILPTPYFDRARIKANSGNLNGAIEDYNNILRLYPKDSFAYFDRGVIHLAMKDSAEACKDWRKALELGYKGASMVLDQYCHSN